MPKPGSFLQSAEWEEFQKCVGFEVKRFSDGTLAIRRPLPFGKSWIYVPRGNFSQGIVDWAKQERAIFIRVEPFFAPEGATQGKLVDQHVQPQHTIILDLEKPEEDLLANMHQKTRYNIRLAEKKGVTVRFSRDKKDLDKFLAIKKDVEARGSFRFHPDGYYQMMLEVLAAQIDPLPSAEAEGLPFSKGEKITLELVIAEKDSVVLAVHLLISYGDTVTYAHGASSSEQRELMAPHLLQWESIKRAKQQGFKKYDFYGIAPERSEGPPKPWRRRAHAWSGITRFKLGFGGARISYPGTFDYVLDPFWYWLYNLRHKLK